MIRNLTIRNRDSRRLVFPNFLLRVKELVNSDCRFGFLVKKPFRMLRLSSRLDHVERNFGNGNFLQIFGKNIRNSDSLRKPCRRHGFRPDWTHTGTFPAMVAANFTNLASSIGGEGLTAILAAVVFVLIAKNLINNKTIHGGMIPKMKTCIDAINNGVRAVVILDGRKPHSILFELFSDKGSGTLIRK